MQFTLLKLLIQMTFWGREMPSQGRKKQAVPPNQIFMTCLTYALLQKYFMCQDIPDYF